ncbi:MAG: SRPBCC domain-containing protein [Gemmatimonadaceae bacterium]|nr:SRPBCC domain-containing protein [Gemmatimonadaceae bacterium]
MVRLNTADDLADYTLDLTETVRISAPIADAFAALLEELGPENRGMGEQPMPMVLEARPGGRWYRDLGDGNGHYWGVVQAIRVPTLLEINGPLMMSFAVASNVQYRLKQDGDDTIITIRHTALGMFPDGYKIPLTQGWQAIFRRLAARFE